MRGCRNVTNALQDNQVRSVYKERLDLMDGLKNKSDLQDGYTTQWYTGEVWMMIVK
jgi:hypothetical protein